MKNFPGIKGFLKKIGNIKNILYSKKFSRVYLNIYNGTYSVIKIIDLRDLTKPKVIGKITPSSLKIKNDKFYVTNIALSPEEKYLYLLEEDRGIIILDVKNPKSPVPRGDFFYPWSRDWIYRFCDMAVSQDDGRIYLIGSGCRKKDYPRYSVIEIIEVKNYDFKLLHEELIERSCDSSYEIFFKKLVITKADIYNQKLLYIIEIDRDLLEESLLLIYEEDNSSGKIKIEEKFFYKLDFLALNIFLNEDKKRIYVVHCLENKICVYDISNLGKLSLIDEITIGNTYSVMEKCYLSDDEKMVLIGDNEDNFFVLDLQELDKILVTPDYVFKSSFVENIFSLSVISERKIAVIWGIDTNYCYKLWFLDISQFPYLIKGTICLTFESENKEPKEIRDIKVSSNYQKIYLKSGDYFSGYKIFVFDISDLSKIKKLAIMEAEEIVESLDGSRLYLFLNNMKIIVKSIRDFSVLNSFKFTKKKLGDLLILSSQILLGNKILGVYKTSAGIKLQLLDLERGEIEDSLLISENYRNFINGVFSPSGDKFLLLKKLKNKKRKNYVICEVYGRKRGGKLELISSVVISPEIMDFKEFTAEKGKIYISPDEKIVCLLFKHGEIKILNFKKLLREEIDFFSLKVKGVYGVTYSFDLDFIFSEKAELGMLIHKYGKIFCLKNIYSYLT